MKNSSELIEKPNTTTKRLQVREKQSKQIKGEVLAIVQYVVFYLADGAPMYQHILPLWRRETDGTERTHHLVSASL